MDHGNIICKIEEALSKYVPDIECMERSLVESMRYSLLAGGKRIRPIILLEFCELCGGDVDSAMPFACALEMIHTYSLIHDDLPCIDNDNFRRGKLSNHLVYGEDVALLSGDALLTLAFQTMLSKESIRGVGSDVAARAACVLAERAGMFGMVGGQIIDIKSQNKNVNVDTLKIMDNKKTGELICSAAEIGCIIAGADQEKIDAAIKYSSLIGLAFQIIDDIIDVNSTEQMIGKPIGSDQKKNKSTYVSTLGIEESQKLAKKLTNDAIESLYVFNGDTSNLKQLAVDLLERNF